MIMSAYVRAHPVLLDDATLRGIIARLRRHLDLLYGPNIPPNKDLAWSVKPAARPWLGQYEISARIL